MKNTTRSRVLAILLAASCLMLCLAGCASEKKTSADSSAAGSASSSAAGSASSSATYEKLPATGDTLRKDETVYVLCNADGSVNKVIVSDWLKNGTKDASITDKTDLKDIETVKGNATYTLDSDNMTIWDAQSGDVFYKGTSTKDLPVNVKVSYQLDGKDVTAEDLAGKSGKVTIRFDYTNTQYETATVDGKETKIYVPFVMLTGMVLDNEKFTNIEVSNGKLVSTGDQAIVMGFAVPGMQESLGIDKDQLELPDYVEVSADVTDFSLDTVLTMASTKLLTEAESDKTLNDLKDSNSENLDELNNLDDSLSQLTDAMTKLTDGSDELYTNMQTLLKKSNDLASGVQKLAAAVKQLDNGSTTLYNGSISLRDNLKTLQTGLGKLSGSSASLDAGAKQVFQSLLDQANAQIKASGASLPTLTIENYDQVLSSANLASSVSAQAEATARSQVTAAVKAQEPTIKAGVTTAVQLGTTAAVLNQATGGAVSITIPQNPTQDDLTKAAAQIQTAMSSLPAASQAGISQAVTAQMSTAQAQTTISNMTAAKEQQLIDQNMSSSAVTSAMSSAVAQARQGESTLAALKTQLDSYNKFYQGLQTYTAGVDSAYAGSQKLTAGANQLATGYQTLSSAISQLDSAVSTLNTQVAQLPDGVSKLTDGAMQLSDGLKELNDKGFSKLEGLMGNGVSGLKDRVDAIKKAADDYNNYSGIAEGMDGSVQFVFKTAEVGDTNQ
jgi:putative membrane protein